MEQQRQLTLEEKTDLMFSIMLLVALTVIVFTRHRVGYRLLGPVRLSLMAVTLFLMATLVQTSANRHAFQLFALLMLVVGLAQRFRRWLEVRRGIQQQHSLYVGDSLFESQWLPNFLLRNRRFSRFFDAFLCVGIGAYLLKACPLLGGWLVFAGLALRISEDILFRKDFNRRLDTADGMIVSQAQARTVDEISHPTRQERRCAQSIATGLSPDLAQKIAQRKKQDS